jgi:phosphoglycerate dehydrogenase-like enzyme
MTALANSHHLPDLLDWQREHKWASPQEVKPIMNLYGQRLGVLGYGSIGRQGKPSVTSFCSLDKTVS